MGTVVDKIIDDILRAEGGYVDHKDDLGGATCYGITQAVARQNGFHGNMKDLPYAFAKQVYLNKYYLEPKFDKVAMLSEEVAAELTDCGVNLGTRFPKEFLQSALNLLNRDGKDYDDIVEDGVLGPATMRALASYLSKRGVDGEKVLLRVLNIMQGSRYIEITKARSANASFFYGWILNRVKVKGD